MGWDELVRSHTAIWRRFTSLVKTTSLVMNDSNDLIVHIWCEEHIEHYRYKHFFILQYLHKPRQNSWLILYQVYDQMMFS